ncbi:MOSC domain-containing protein [Hahella sp. KA22]|uniref:MOSC domain-containing protein n=1 Tax=Hahella sp. KA22 TaxID=1628392 RepID=UPI0013E2B4B6|nr:MOSC N-terminal beta barrel domain-containing protein [Hahella sp. KA22]
MQSIGVASSLWRYPVKSLLGETIDALAFDERGVEGDRIFAVRNGAGKFGSGKNTRRFARMEGLLTMSARWDAGSVLLRLPDGRVMSNDHPDLNQALSSVLGQEVELVREAAVSHLDAGPVHLISTSALHWLRGLLPESLIDERRFRPNILLSTSGVGVVEHDWLGKTLSFSGGLRLHISGLTERCVMTGMRQSDLPDDLMITRAIGEHTQFNFGVYAQVMEPGILRQGEHAFLE